MAIKGHNKTPEQQLRESIKGQRASVRRWEAAAAEWPERLRETRQYREIIETLEGEKAFLADLNAQLKELS